MAAGNTTRLEELTKLATDFVTTQKGLWDHEAWTDFTSKVRAKGFDISDDMQANLGEMLEAMKQFYTAAAATGSVEKALQAAVNESLTFVKRHQGVWGHPEWEDFVKTVERNTLSLSEGATAYLGGILESLKTLYALSPVGRMQQATRTKETPVAAAPKIKDAAEPTATKPAGTKTPQEPKKTATKPVPDPPAVPKTPPKPDDPKKTPPAASSRTKDATEPMAIKPAGAKTPQEPKKTATKPAAPEPPAAPKTPPQQDDLTAIGGIGSALAKKLNGAGITSYAQLAALSEADIARLERDIIRFPGRIKRDDWVGQAKKLVQGR